MRQKQALLKTEGTTQVEIVIVGLGPRPYNNNNNYDMNKHCMHITRYEVNADDLTLRAIKMAIIIIVVHKLQSLVG